MSRRFHRPALVVALVALVAWVVFFDSHSVVRRAEYARELARAAGQNDALRAEIGAHEAALDRGLDAETVERVAREQYGMRRPGEVVYRVLPASE